MRPHSPLTPCTETAPTGSSTLSRPSTKTMATTTSRPATRPINAAPCAFVNTLGAALIGLVAGQHAVGGHRRVGLAVTFPYQKHRREAAECAGDERVDDHDSEPQVGRRQCGCAVEAHPAEDEDDDTEDGERQVVGEDHARRTVLGELADAWPQHQRPGEGREAAHGVDYSRAGEVEGAMAQTEVAAQCAQPAATPHPVAVDGVHDGGHEEAVHDEGRELPALGHGARGDGGGGVHEHELKEEEAHDRHIVAAPPEKEALVTDHAPPPVSYTHLTLPTK